MRALGWLAILVTALSVGVGCSGSDGGPAPGDTGDVLGPDTTDVPGQDTPQGDTPQGDTPLGDTPLGDTPQGDTPLGDTPQGDTPQGDTPLGDTPLGDTPQGDTPQGDTPLGDTPQGDTPQGDTPQGDGGPTPQACEFPFEVPPVHHVSDGEPMGFEMDVPETHYLCRLQYADHDALVFVRAIPVGLQFWDVLFEFRDAYVCERAVGEVVSVPGDFQLDHHGWEHLYVTYDSLRYHFRYAETCVGYRPCGPTVDMFEVLPEAGGVPIDDRLTTCVRVKEDGTVPPLVPWHRVPTSGSDMFVTFTMGSPDGTGAADEHPAHAVRVLPAQVDRAETTNAEFAVFLTANGNDCNGQPCLAEGGALTQLTESAGMWLPVAGYADRPVAGVTWYGADAYCWWMGKPLPSEAHFERFMRGPAGATYPWGEAAPDCSLAVFADASGAGCGTGDVAPVCSRPASPEGLCDLAGNVREWTADWYAADYYAPCGDEPCDRPTGPDSGTERVIRGGGFRTLPEGLRAAARDHADPATGAADLGFRCANSFQLLDP